jgi:phage terminase large subunit
LSSLSIEIPDIFQNIFKPARYKVLYGGRGSAKSWTIARVLIMMASLKPLRVLCGREIQNSIKESVYKIIQDQIFELGLSGNFKINQTEIKGINGSEFIFEGLRHNITKIKSYEGIDIAWIEEAQVVSRTSWETLIPTIRKEGSEIWISFNPELEEDETYQRFVINQPPDSIVIKANYMDNPWFPDVLEKERQYLKAVDIDAYMNIWEGHCRAALQGAIYAEELRKAREENRITNIPVDMGRPVDVFFDLGWADCTSLWFVQVMSMELRLVDFMQNQLKALQFYVTEMQRKGYIYGRLYLPFDGNNKQLSTGKSIKELLEAYGFKVVLVPKLSLKDGIQAVRTVFPKCYFDEKRCADGLSALRRYRYELNTTTGQYMKDPLHDENSHAADAFRYFAVGYQAQPKPQTSVTSILNQMYLGA